MSKTEGEKNKRYLSISLNKITDPNRDSYIFRGKWFTDDITIKKMAHGQFHSNQLPQYTRLTKTINNKSNRTVRL